jgi:hypothetical protein
LPKSSKERIFQPANIALGDVSIDISPVTAGVQKQFRGDRNGANLVLPAGAYSIYLRHADATGGTITVNGEPIRFNGTFSKGAQVDQVNNKQDFVGEVTIDNPDGKTYWLDVVYPSSSSFNPNVI